MNNTLLGNNFDHSITMQFLRRWKKALIIIAALGLIGSSIAAFLIHPMYLATAVIFPTNSNRISKAIMDYHYSLDFMDYGTERDCEYAIQILSSRTMEDAVCEHFGLMTHYAISPDDPHAKYKLHQDYISNVSIKRTEFLGVSISCLDREPTWSANMANYIAETYDSICHILHHDRALDAHNIMQGVCEQMEKDVKAYEDSLAIDPAHKITYQQLLDSKTKELANLQTRATETEVDLDSQVRYKFWLDHATTPDKKAYPKRTLVIALGTAATLILGICILLIIGMPKKEEEMVEENQSNSSK